MYVGKKKAFSNVLLGLNWPLWSLESHQQLCFNGSICLCLFQGYYIKVKTIWALFTCSKNCLPKIHQIQPLNWPAHWNTILFSFLTISLSFLSAIAISNSAKFQQSQSPRFIFTIKGQLFVWKVSFRKIIWCADFVENEMRDPSVITEIN